METLTTKKIFPGLYTVTAAGVDYEIRSLGGDVAGFGGWTWMVAGEAGNDIYATKRDAVAALTEWVASLAPVVESRGAMMLRMKRAFDARCAAEGITVGR